MLLKFELFSGMLRFRVFHQLVLTIVLGVAKLTLVRFVFQMSALVVVAISDSGEVFLTVGAFIRPFACMSP